MRIKPLLIALSSALCVTSIAHAGVTLSSPTVAAVYVSSINVQWISTNTATGYILEASSTSSGTPPLFSSTTFDNALSTLTVTGLSPDTTYYLLVGGMSAGTTNFIGPVPSTSVTLSPAINPSVVQVSSWTIGIIWTVLTSTQAVGYKAQVSTMSDFTGVLLSSAVMGNSVGGAMINGLSASTTYYLRAGALNWVQVPNYIAFGSTTTSVAAGLAAPTGFTANATSVSSVLWTWGLVTGATGYNLYLATAPATLVASTPTLTYSETALAANTPYGLFVQAAGGGLLGPLSASATAYTFANLPTVPTMSNIGSSSFTVTFGTTGNPGYTPYQIEVAPNNSFATGVSTPVPFTANLTANTTNIVGLAPNTQYWVRVTAKNGNGFNTNPGPSANATTKQNGVGSSAGSGLGTATLAPASVPEGGVVTTTITFKVPPGGMSPGGRLEIDAPPGWWPNILQNYNSAQDGYVTATSTAVGLNLFFASTSPVISVSFPTGFLGAGSTIQVTINNIHPNCPAPNQSQIGWEIKSAMSALDPLGDITSQPSQALAVGQAQWIGYNPWNVLTVVANQPSQAITLQANDNCGQPAVLASPVTVNLYGLLSTGATDFGAAFSASSTISPSTTSVTIPAASSMTVYYYQTSTFGSNLQIEGTYPSPVGAYSQQVWRPVSVVASAPTFSNVSIDNGSPVAGQKTVPLSPDGSGINNFAYIRFTPSDNTTQWHVVISSNNFQTFVFERWGSGDPQGTINWDGRSFNPAAGTAAYMPQPVPNGTYTVKVEYPGLVKDTSLSMTINTSQISGHVTFGGNSVPGAMVNAQATNGPGFSFATTDASGNYTLYGVRSGTSYNLYVTYVSTSNQAVVTAQANSVTAPGTKNFTLSAPGVIRVAAATNVTPNVPSFGSVNAHSSDYSKNYNGNIRLLPGTTTSDNGDPFSPSTWTYLYVDPTGGPYTLHFYLQGFGINDLTVPASSDVVVNLLQKANVYGLITLPAPVAVPTWIPVEGVLGTNSYPTIWGGTSFNIGQSSAVYSIFAVDPGVYTFRARPSGFVPASITNVTVAGSDLGNAVTGTGVDFSSNAFSTGGQITGQITVNGDTSSQPNPFTLWMSAYSPSLGLNVFTQVQLSTSSSSTGTTYQMNGVANGSYQVFPPYLPGFEVSPPGPQTITVSGGAATYNVTLNQVTGKIKGAVTLPAGQSDYTNVHLALQGPYSQDVDMAVSTYSLNNLGTGNYSLVATYKTSGAQTTRSFILSNGQTLTQNLDLSASTYSVSGVVSIQNAFTIRNSSNSLVTINTLTDLLGSATSQTVYLNANTAIPGTAGTAAGAVGGCSGGTPTTISTVRVEAFPKNFNSFGNANRSSFNNCFGVGQYKYSVVDSSGNYTITGLSAGVWEVSVYPYFDNGQVPDAAVSKQIITVVNGSVGNVNFPLSNGYAVSGTISLPSGITDTRQFNAQIVSPRGDAVQSAQVMITGVGSVSYQFTGLPSGQYALIIQDFGSYDQVLNRNVVKYVTKPIQFTIAGADLTNVNVTLSRSASIVGKLLIQGANPDGTSALTLITANNQNLLPSNFNISANANPWVPGGYAQAQWGPNGGIYIDSNNQFHIDGVAAATYDVSFRQNSYGLAIQGAGSINLANYTQGSVIVSDGQTLDLGTISLKPGLSLSGTISDQSGNPISNIRVRAQAATDKHGNNSIEVYSDATGHFTLAGLDSGARIYNITAAPRPSPGENISFVPYGQVQKLAVDVTVVPLPDINFVLPDANAQISGHIVTADGGSLSYPESDQAGFPVADVYLHLQGSNTDDNPLGQSNATGLDGTFNIPYLVPGLYDITVESLGYRPLKLSGITLSANTLKDLGTLTLQNGPELDVTLARPDGSSVNTNQVQTAVAATPDLSSIIFGKVKSDASTNNIISIQFSGFELSPKTYNILLFDNQDNITTPPEGRTLVFTSTGVFTRALTYSQSAPFAFADVKKSGSGVSITYYFSRPIRNRGDDQNPAAWFATSPHPERLSGHTLSGDRRQLTVLYTPIANELNDIVVFSAHSVDVDPTTGVEFALNKTLTLLLGQKATSENNVNPALGGSVSLATSNDPSNISIPANALLTSTGSAVDAGTSYSFTFTATDDANSLAAGSIHATRTAALPGLIARGSAAYVSEAYAAMGAARVSASINPLSSFYSVLLPAGLSHSLNQTAFITLNYDTGADPNQINVYYFDGAEYLLESNQRTVDTVNRTITVGVNHFSTFVVLQNSNPVVIVTGSSGTGAGIDVFNFPNPFDLQTKVKNLAHNDGTHTTIQTDGTVIRYFIPGAMAGSAHIDIFDVVGEKVRSIDLGVPTGDIFNYVAWDGKNAAGNKVASGVYIGVLKVGGNKAFWKMAVIK